MAEQKIIALRDGAPLPDHIAEPVPAVIDECLRLLEAARAGKLRGLNACALYMELGYCTVSCGEGTTLEILGSLRMLEFDICTRASRDASERR